MTTLTDLRTDVVGGVDTHGEVHVAAVLDERGRLLATASFATTAAGNRQLLGWLRGYGEVARVGVEGTGSWGAGLCRYLVGEGVGVVEVDRPNRQDRRRRGKSDTIDAEAAARAALNGSASGAPKSGDGDVEAIRALRVVRRSAMRGRIQALHQLRALCSTAPQELRDQLRGLGRNELVQTCMRMRVADAATPSTAAKFALRELGVASVCSKTSSPASTPNWRRWLLVHVRSCSHCAGSGPTAPRSCWSPPATTADASAAKHRSRSSAVSRHSKHRRDVCAVTASTGVVTAKPTMRCGGSCWSACTATRAPAPTSPAAAPKGSAPKRSCAA